MSIEASGVTFTLFGTTVKIESIAIPTNGLVILATVAVIFRVLQSRTAPAPGGNPAPSPSPTSNPFSTSCASPPSRSSSCPPPPPPPPPPPFEKEQKGQKPLSEQPEKPSWLGMLKDITNVKLRSTENYFGGNKKNSRPSKADPFMEELKDKVALYYKT